MDLADAHTRALRLLQSGQSRQGVQIVNLGTGAGTTVLEAIQAFESVSGVALNYRLADRRQGDVVAIYADYSRAAHLLEWRPQRDIRDIMKSAWLWERCRVQC